MPFTQIIPASFPSWEFDTGPGMLQTTLMNRGNNMASPLEPSYEKSSFMQTPATIYTTQAPNSVPPVLAVHRGVPCWSMTPAFAAGGAGFWFGYNAMIDLSTAEFASSVSVLPPNRVYIDEFMIAFDTPAVMNTSAKIAVYAPINFGTTPVLQPGIVGEQYGIRPDGVGGFNWFSAIGGIQQDAVAITWPEADLGDWVCIRVEHFNARSPAIPAFVRFWINDVNIVTRSWGGGSVLPDYSGENKFHRLVNNWANTSTAIFVAQFRSRVGSFDAAGVSIQ